MVPISIMVVKKNISPKEPKVVITPKSLWMTGISIPNRDQEINAKKTTLGA